MQQCTRTRIPRRRRWPARLGALAIGTAAAVAPASAADVHVDLAGFDSPGCGTAVDPCRSIQFAADEATAGDRVLIATGNYAENVTVRSSVMLLGAGASSTVVDGGHRGSVFVIVDGHTVTIADLTITRGSGDHAGGIAIGTSTVSLRAVELSENTGSNGGEVHSPSGSAG